MTSEMRQLYIQHGRNYINIIKSWCPRDEKVYYIICPAIYRMYSKTIQQRIRIRDNPACRAMCMQATIYLSCKKQKFNNLIHKNLFHRHNTTYTQIRNIYWANGANDQSLTVKLRLSKKSHRQFQYRLPELVCEAGRA